MNLKLILSLLLLILLGFPLLVYYIISYINKQHRQLKEALKEYLTLHQFQSEKEEMALKEDLSHYVMQKEYQDLKESMSLISDSFQIDAVSKGNEELSDTNYKIAEIYFKQALFRDPKQVNAWVGLGLANFRLEQYRDALDSIRTAIKLDQKEPLFDKQGQISAIAAEILIKLGQYQEAQHILETEVLKKNPSYSKAKTLLAQCQTHTATLSESGW